MSKLADFITETETIPNGMTDPARMATALNIIRTVKAMCDEMDQYELLVNKRLLVVDVREAMDAAAEAKR